MRVWIATGGTGGHIFPACSVGDKLINLGHKVIISVDRRGFNIIDRKKYKVCLIWASGVGAKNKFFQIFSLFKIAISSIYLFFRFIINRPDCIVGFGGYSSVPAIFAGFLLKIPTLLHEQNGYIGRANKFLLRFIDVLMVSFKITKGIDKRNIKIVYTGLPVRSEFLKFSNSKLPMNRKILITGGSLGSQIIDKVIPESLIGMKKIFVTHQTRPENVEILRKFYFKNNISANVIPFINDMASVIKNSDLVIGRSGASTVVELMTIGRPAILIPLNINLDQINNAKNMESLGGAIVVEQQKLNIKLVHDIVSSLFNNKARLQKMAEKAFVENYAIDNIIIEILKFK